MSKITLTTLKKFIKTNRTNLLIKNMSDYDGMADGVRDCNNKGFRVAVPTDSQNDHPSHTLGIKGIWLVGNSRDYFTAFNDVSAGLNGIEVTNSCGNFVVAVKTLL